MHRSNIKVDETSNNGSARSVHRTLWREISNTLHELGFLYHAEWAKCRWKTLFVAYRRVVDHNNKSGNDQKEMAFHTEALA